MERIGRVSAWFLVVSIALLTSCIVGGGPPKVAAPALTFELKDERWANGLRVIFETVPKSETAGLVLAVRAGSMEDPPGKEGLAHLVEHLVFRAQHGQEPSIAHRLNAVAARWNGVTTHETALYHAFAHERALGELASVFAELMSDPLAGVAEGEFAHEQRVVEAERGFRLDHGSNVIDQWLDEAIFETGSARSRPVGGSRESIARLTLDDARAYSEKLYRPERMTLYVIAQEGSNALQQVQAALLERIDGRAAVAVNPSIPRFPVGVSQPGVLQRRRGAVDTPELWFQWVLPGSTVKERATAEVIAEVARAGIAPGFLSHPHIASADCHVEFRLRQALLRCQLFLNETREAEKVTTRALDQLRKRFQFGAESSRWFWWLRQRFALRKVLDLENLETRALIRTLAAHNDGTPLYQQSLISAVDALDLQQVASYAYQALATERAAILLIEPEPLEPSFPPAATGLATPIPNVDDSGAPVPPVKAVLDQLLAPPQPEFTRFRLSNGLEVIQLPSDGPYINMLLGFRGGRAWSNDPKVGRAAYESEIWRVDPNPTDWGIDLERAREDDYQLELIRTVSADLDKTLEVLSAARAMIVEWPSLSFRRALPAQLRWEASPSVGLSRALNHAQFGEHPYGVFADAAETEAAKVQGIRRFVTSVRRPDNAVLIVTSSRDEVEVRSAVERAFGHWPVDPNVPRAQLPEVKLLPNVAPQTVVVNDPGATQVSIEFSCLLPRAGLTEFVTHRLLSQFLADATYEALRERLGIAYGAWPTLRPTLARVDAVGIGTRVARQHLPGAIAALQQIINTETFEEAPFERTRWKTVSSYLFLSDTSTERALAAYQEWLFELPTGEFATRPKLLAETPRAAVQAQLANCRQRGVFAFHGDERTIRDALRSDERAAP